jgi:hypothetical protein
MMALCSAEPAARCRRLAFSRQELQIADRARGSGIISYQSTIEPDLDDLTAITAEDADWFAGACDAGGTHSHRHYFPSLMFYSGRGRLVWERHADSILVYQVLRQPDRIKLYLAPFPFSSRALDHALRRMRDYNRGAAGRIKWIPEEDVLAVARHGLDVSHREDEYIFDRSAVMRLEGSGFAKLRQEISRAKRAGQVEIRRYSAQDRETCIRLAETWKTRLEAGQVKVGGHWTKTACLAGADKLGLPILNGIVVTVDGIVRGFAFAGRINADMGCNYLSVTDSQFRGLPHLLCYALMEAQPELPFFNDGNDAGRPGLREQKERFRPAGKHGVYGAWER